MTINEVLADQTPNAGREIWNANDLELEAGLKALAFNVKADPFQAKGDGIADDLPAIQAAVDARREAGGGYVFLPPGTYILGSGPLLMRDGVHLIGAGHYNTFLKLGDNVNSPVITDDGVTRSGGSAFGRVYLSNFSIDGNRDNNFEGQEGIFTSAYFSTFENLMIRNCRTHGIRMGTQGMTNASSQNRIVGCRIFSCGGAGLYLDIKGIDHTVTQNYIYDCDFGVLIRNGGIRLVNNDIYRHRLAGIQVQQTAYGLIIASNDLNGNKRYGMHFTRSTVNGERQWGQFLVEGNSILGDGLEADNAFDGIWVETSVRDGIANLSLLNNKIFTLPGSNRYRYGINLERNVTESKCAGNHIHAPAAGLYNIGRSCSKIELDSLGGAALEAPAIPSSGVPFANPFHVPVTIYIKGNGVTGVAINDVLTGSTTGSFTLMPGKTVTLLYSQEPGWVWFAY